MHLNRIKSKRIPKLKRGNDDEDVANFKTIISMWISLVKYITITESDTKKNKVLFKDNEKKIIIKY